MKETQLTEKWLRSRYLILKKSDRLDPKLVFVNDVLPLRIEDKKFLFCWGDSVKNETHIKTVKHLKSLYQSLTNLDFPTYSFS